MHDAFIEKMKATANGMVMGDPLDDSTVLGPLIHRDALDRVNRMVDEAVAGGATLTCGGAPTGEGTFYPPTIIAGAKPDDTISQEEVFGPVTTAFAFDQPQEAVRLANRSRYGLAASVWTQNLQRAHKTVDRLAAGYIWVNAYGTIPYSTPFGGIKSSGHGREGGRDALVGFTRLKNVFVQL